MTFSRVSRLRRNQKYFPSTPLERARKKTSLSVFYCGKRRNDKRQMRLKEEDPASPKIVAAANPVT